MHDIDRIFEQIRHVFPRAPRLGSARTAGKQLPVRALLVGIFFLLFAITGFSADATNSPALEVTNSSALAVTNSPALTFPNSPALPLTLPPLPEAGPSVLRVFGALVLVIGIFLGGAWLFRNWQRLTMQRGRSPKLNVLETRPLGGKHALYVIGYEQERFLLSSSPAGVSLLSHLPTATETAPTEIKPTGPAPSFAQALTQVLKGKTPSK
jgi:flagellar biogenesis protein FliO